MYIISLTRTIVYIKINIEKGVILIENTKEKIENIVTVGLFYLLLIILVLAFINRYEELNIITEESNIASCIDY